MPRSKYDKIYHSLKTKIETGEYEFQAMLPSENQLILIYDCSRNTIRRAISALVTDGYVQTMQGKGVRNIFQPTLQTSFTIGGIESFKESAIRNNQIPKTEVLYFAELTSDKKIEARTGFAAGTDLYYLPAAALSGRKSTYIKSQLFFKGCCHASDERNCGTIDLRISGARASYNDRYEQAHYDG